MQAALPPSPTPRPPSTDLSALSSPDFSPQGFISSIRSRAPLRVVRDDLRAHLASLQADLVACVQRDFHVFTSFSSSIADADALADVAARPLANLRADLDALLADLNAQIDDLDSTLTQRREAAARSSALRTLIFANELLVKCERLLGEYRALPSGAPAESLNLAERIAGEAAQLSFTLRRAVDGAFVTSISARISTVRRGVRNCMEVWLRRALNPSADAKHGAVYDNDILSRVLAMYVVSGMAAEAEEFFRREVVVPFTSARLRMATMLVVAERNIKNGNFEAKRDAQTKQAGGTAATSTASVSVTAADALEAAEREVVTFLGEKVTPIVSLCEAEERLRTKLDFVGRAVWPQVQRAIASHMSAAFSPGIPDVFHQSVVAGSRLHAAMEAAVGNEEHRVALLKSSATAEFWKHWNLPVYFQLRFQEVTSKFDQHLNDGPVAYDSSEFTRSDVAESGSRLLRTNVYHAVPTASLVASLRRCWSEEVFLRTLTHRFLRLSLQLLARYATWVRTGLAGEWTSADAVPRGAARVFHDITVIQKRIPAELASVLRLRAPSLSHEGLDSIDSAFTDATDTYSSLLPELSRSISDSLSKSCVENLQPLRGILATYRMSSKQAPTTHSSFVPKILRPLKTFLKEQETMIEQAELMKIASAVAEATSGEYFNMATDLLQRNKSSEATLRRLNIGRSGAMSGGGTNSTSVIDKISMQLYLDVANFKDDIQALGVSPEDVCSLGRLWNSVKRDDEVDGDESAEAASLLSTAATEQKIEATDGKRPADDGAMQATPADETDPQMSSTITPREVDPPAHVREG